MDSGRESVKKEAHRKQVAETWSTLKADIFTAMRSRFGIPTQLLYFASQRAHLIEDQLGVNLFRSL